MTQWKPKFVPATEQRGLPDLNPPPLEVEGGGGTVPHIYYARRDTHPTQPGWIINRDSHPIQQAKYIKGGWTPREEFGSFVYGMFGNDQVKDANGVLFDSAKEPYRVFFQRGGAEHMPVDQVIAYGWHITPPYKGVKFPQVDNLDIPRFQCAECPHRPFVASIHLKTHLESTHKYTRMELIQYANDEDISWERRIEHHEQVAAAEAEPETFPDLNLSDDPVLETETVLSCDDCDYTTPADSKQHKTALRMHRRIHASPEPEPVAAGVSEETTHGHDANLPGDGTV